MSENTQAAFFITSFTSLAVVIAGSTLAVLVKLCL